MAKPFDVRIVGTALISFGLTAFNTVEGLGLNTFGFLWPFEGIWSPCIDVPVTSWEDCPCEEESTLS